MTIPRFEDSLTAALRSEAEAAMRTTDTERELDRLEDRLGRDRGVRRRWIGAGVAACVVAAAVAVGVTLQSRSTSSAPPAEGDRTGPTRLDLGGVASPLADVPAPAVDDRQVPVVIDGLGRVWGSHRRPDGTVWVLSAEPATQQWTLRRLSPDRSRVDLSLQFTAEEVRGATDAADVLVLAVTRGAPDPDVTDFADLRDGLLRVDLSSGEVLGFTPVDRASRLATAADGTVWAVTGPDEVAQLDPRTGRVIGRLRPPGLVDQVIVLGDRLWLAYLAGAPSRGYLVEQRSGRVVRTATASGLSLHVKAAGGVVVMERGGRLVRVDADGSTRGVQLPFAPSATRQDIAGADERDVWVTVEDSLIRLDGRSLAVLGGVTLPWKGPYYVTRDGDGVLVGDPIAGSLRRLPDAALATE